MHLIACFIIPFSYYFKVVLKNKAGLKIKAMLKYNVV